MLTSSSFKKNHDYIYQQALKWQATLLYFFFPGSTKESTQVGCCPMANSEQKINRKEKKKRWGERKEVKKWHNTCIYIYIDRSLKLWILYPEKREKIIGKSWNALSQQLGISINLYIYIYKTESFETSTFFHVSIYLFILFFKFRFFFCSLLCD